MYFDVLIFGNYLDCASPLLRADLSKVLLKFNTQCRQHNSTLRVITSDKDNLHPLILRACRSLNISVEKAPAERIKTLAEKKAFVLIYKLVCPTSRSERVTDLMEAFSTYVEGILDYLDEADLEIREIKVPESILIKAALPTGVPINQGKVQVLDYSEIKNYIDTWFNDVVTPLATPSMDRDAIPSQEESPNTWLIGNTSQS